MRVPDKKNAPHRQAICQWETLKLPVLPQSIRFPIAMQCTELSLVLPDMLPRLWSFALRLTENEYEAEELVHQACARGLEDSHTRPPDTSPLDWMFSIVYSIWRDDPMGHARRDCAPKKRSPSTQHLFQKNVFGIDPPG